MFQIPKTATTNGERFKALYTVWREVYATLSSIGTESHLNNALTMKTFVRKLPPCNKDRYVKFKEDPAMKRKLAGEAMCKFMEKERTWMKNLAST